MNDPPKVFVSYAHEDLPTVAWEADAMRLGGIDVFLDFQSMRTGADWPDTLLKAVCNASRFILFWSRFSASPIGSVTNVQRRSGFAPSATTTAIFRLSSSTTRPCPRRLKTSSIWIVRARPCLSLHPTQRRLRSDGRG